MSCRNCLYFNHPMLPCGGQYLLLNSAAYMSMRMSVSLHVYLHSKTISTSPRHFKRNPFRLQKGDDCRGVEN